MTLRATIERVLTNYQAATLEPFASHPLADFIRGEAAQSVRDELGEQGAGLIVEGSAGAGRWAAVPWVGVFDPMVTDTATKGYYAVYLFGLDGTACHLSLNQGTTATRAEFGSDTRRVLADRAALIRGAPG